MTVVLVTQEIGSRGHEVANGIAVGLGLELITQEEVVRLVATRMHAEEARLRRIVSGKATWFERLTIDWHRLANCAAEELIRLAVRDRLVIQSWCAPDALRPVRHVLCVRVRAATPRRTLGRIYFARALSSPPPFGNAHEDEQAEHVVLNTALASVPVCAEQVMRLAQGPLYRRTSASQAMLEGLLQGLHVRVGNAGGIEPRVLDVEVDRKRLRLFGITSNEQAIAQIEERLRSKPALMQMGRQRYPTPTEFM